MALVVEADTPEEVSEVHADISDKARLLQKFGLHEEYASTLEPGNHNGDSLVHVRTNPCDIASSDDHGQAEPTATPVEEDPEYFIVMRSALKRVEPLFAKNANACLDDDMLEALLDVPEELCQHSDSLPEELAYVDAANQPALCMQLRTFLEDCSDEPHQ
mmetsp:Transcript_126264/g.252242  ORF Transcript_126264/g.252242 Transcript_126264/m.252242 type:complete len:160 (+) Transcript_126264:70-549(+)|eukprot:CAMPEP_0172720402 /NCGR_PEP_ID=MMETSP1074-20121228/76811_1 /TAXON_ID=2916 /ORGANISM="Ceratium fusus, Strain PA161109" /LENGTH=159 /DNA_ID=CAMNT_0013545915 /DNA_START=32 /DNA_END=511 /DNA_ORIENTATION=+